MFGAEDAQLERIRNAIRACTDEALESAGGLPAALATARKINARRQTGVAGAPVQVKT